MVSQRNQTRSQTVVRNPAILGGEPSIGGTRISVRSIVLMLKELGSVDAVAREYDLDTRAVAGAIEFYHVNRAEIDRHIEANLADD